MSKQFKGTPGPWRITAFDSVVCGSFAWSSHVEGSFNKYEDEYNAKLIAAAPELLEALRQLRDYVEDAHRDYIHETVDDSKHPMILAKIAINKALGE